MKFYKFIVIFVLLVNYVYPITKLNYAKQLVVLYKVLDPLTVEVDIPEKMTVKSGHEKFKYSEVISSRKPLNVKVEAPYKDRDLILDTIYGTATLELQNNGRFDLKNTKDPNIVIEGRGFFPEVGENVSKMKLELFNSNVANKYQAFTKIDAVFNESQNEMLMGTYKGVMILSVTYGE